ncbi:hypothetical protein LCGC14_1635220 [marine sediment metagenome]|uniref:Uncharacterized protein n=1 Tax=marine sediment metagenome TaxID=412755 RepID=A0A0F9INN1_9ZZZZ
MLNFPVLGLGSILERFRYKTSSEETKSGDSTALSKGDSVVSRFVKRLNSIDGLNENFTKENFRLEADGSLTCIFPSESAAERIMQVCSFVESRGLSPAQVHLPNVAPITKKDESGTSETKKGNSGIIEVVNVKVKVEVKESRTKQESGETSAKKEEPESTESKSKDSNKDTASNADNLKNRIKIIKARVNEYLTNHTEMVLTHPVQAIIYSISIKAFCMLIAPVFTLVAYTTLGASFVIFESVMILHFSKFTKSLWSTTTDVFWGTMGSVFTSKTKKT